MEGFDNQIQDPEVSSVREAEEQELAEHLAEAVELAENMSNMLQATADRVQAVAASTRALEREIEHEQEAIEACDYQIANTQEENVRTNVRLMEINSQINYWQGKLNDCIAELNNLHLQNSEAKMRENTILALIEEERQLIAEFESHGYSVTSNPP